MTERDRHIAVAVQEVENVRRSLAAAAIEVLNVDIRSTAEGREGRVLLEDALRELMKHAVALASDMGVLDGLQAAAAHDGGGGGS